MAGIELRCVSKSFGGRRVLAGVTLSVAAGELLCLLGPSGCGKTTLLRIIAGFETPDAGQLLVGGEDVTAAPATARNFGMVFQAYSLFPNMTALDNVGFGPRVRGLGRAERTARAARLLALVGLEEHAAKYPHQLSGGQQQRVALARALAVEPRVLLLDEPLSALDARVRVQLRDEIRRIQRETGVTTVLVTHDQEEALSISDRVAVMNEGRLVQVATPSVIYREPADAFVARFIGATAALAGRAGDGVVRVGMLALPAAAASSFPVGAPVELFLRPEHARIGAAGSTPPAGAVAAQVHERTFLGSLTRVRVALIGAPEVELRADLPSEEAECYALGDQVWAWWPGTAPCVLAREEGV